MSDNIQYQPSYPFDAICFDCDNTLTNAEGIDELAKFNGVEAQVKTLTDMAMSNEDISLQLYQERLELTKPSQQQFDALSELYYNQKSKHVVDVIEVLNFLNKPIFVISAGNDPAVTQFSAQLSIPSHRVFAVKIFFDTQGNYLGFDESSPMTQRAGKKQIISKIKQKYPKILHIGDGNNDLAVKPIVDLFIGYGGSVTRDGVKNNADVFIECESMLPILPLCLHHTEVSQLSPEHHDKLNQAITLLNEYVTIKDNINI